MNLDNLKTNKLFFERFCESNQNQPIVMTPYHLASQSEIYDRIKNKQQYNLLKYLKDSNLVKQLLNESIQEKNIKLCKLIIEDYENLDHSSYILYVIDHDLIDVFAKLSKKDLNIYDDNKNNIFHKCKSKQMFEILVKLDKSYLNMPNSQGHLPIQQYSYDNNYDLVNLSSQYTTNFTNQSLIDENTIQHIYFGKIFKQCLNIQNKKGETPLHSLLIYDIQKYQSEFITKDMINLQDNKGNTCLHYACIQSNINICRELLENGADMFIRNNDNKLPLHYTYNNIIQDLFVKFIPKNKLLNILRS